MTEKVYQFPGDVRRAYESQPIALVFDQYIGGKVVPLLVSDGFCRLVDKPREEALEWFAVSQYERVHPDDVENVVRVSKAFIRHEAEYNVIFRCRHGADYHYIHAIGEWLTMPDGTELAELVYIDLENSQLEMEKLTEKYRVIQRDAFYTDAVTGLSNTNYLFKFGEETVNALRQRGETPALLYMDVNSMQSYNTLYGFAQGDALLRLIAALLKEKFDDSLIVRGAEDHFIVITACGDRQALAAAVAEVNDRVKKDAYGNTTGIHAGISLFEEDTAVATAMDHARHALKMIGTDLNTTSCFHTAEADDAYWNQRYIVDYFDRALEQNWIQIYYQCISRVETGKGAALEALARWVDPQRGVISPGKFIPTLRKYHLLHRLDLYIFEQACRDVPLRVQAGLPLIPVSVNFSGQDFDHVDVAGELNRIADACHIEDYGASRDYFVVEITEQDMATATDNFYDQLRRIKDSGFWLWMDDFGSGYSSLNVLNRFKFDLIKFDMDLLRNLDDHDGVNRIILQYMVALAKKLGIHTLAEGMENAEQHAFLTDIGCELAQGFGFHRPESLSSMLERARHGQRAVPIETDEERAFMSRKWTADT